MKFSILIPVLLLSGCWPSPKTPSDEDRQDCHEKANSKARARAADECPPNECEEGVSGQECWEACPHYGSINLQLTEALTECDK